MRVDRRQFLELLVGAGVSAVASSWLVDRALALAAQGELPVALGPGIESWVPTACGFCPGGCGLEVRRIDGLPVGVRGYGGHLVNRGRLCPLPPAAIQMLFGPDRIQRPLLRAGRRLQGKWTEIPWDEAEGLVVERVRQLVQAGSPERIAFLDGRLEGVGRLVAERFMRDLGSPHFVATGRSLEDELAQRMFGWERAPGADLENARVILLLRFAHLETDGSPVWQSRLYGVARDRTIDRPVYISIGPRLLGSAAKCDHWLAARPGTEAIVALAMAHVILEKGWEDRAFLEKSTDWAESSAGGEHGVLPLLRAISPEVASEMTGVPRQAIEDAAGLFARHRPGVALAGPGTPANPSGRLLPWAANLLNTLVGSVGVRGGIVERAKPPLAALSPKGDERGRAPAGGPAITDATQLAQALLTSTPTPIDLLFVRDANPVFDSPLARAFHRGLRQGDRMVVAFATELDETAQLADVVFPEPTFLERWDILTGTPVVPLGHATLQQPVVEPLFSARQSEEVLARVSHALEGVIASSFQATRAEELVQQASRGLFADARGGLRDPAASFREFRAAFQSSIVWAFSPQQSSSSRPMRRISILPRPFFDAGGGPAAGSLQDVVRPRSTSDRRSYPYELAVFRTPHLQDGRTANLPMMMELAGHWAAAMWVTWVEIHPRTAASSGVRDGDTVAVVSELGHIQGIVQVSAATPPGVVAIPLGLGHDVGSTAAGVGANPNLIVASHLDDPALAGLERVTRVKLVRV